MAGTSPDLMNLGACLVPVTMLVLLLLRVGVRVSGTFPTSTIQDTAWQEG